MMGVFNFGANPALLQYRAKLVLVANGTAADRHHPIAAAQLFLGSLERALQRRVGEFLGETDDGQTLLQPQP